MNTATATSMSEDVSVTADSANYMLELLRATGWFGKETIGSDFSACLPMLLVALRWHGKVRHICEALPYNNQGIDCIDFLNTMANLGLEGKAEQLSLGDIDPRLLPCLFVPEGHDGKTEHAMVVLLRTEEDIQIFYGGTEEIVAIEADVDVPGTAYFFHEIDHENDLTNNKARIENKSSWFRVLLSRFFPVFLQIFIASLALNFLSLATPLFIMFTYDKVIGAHSPHTLKYLLVGVTLGLLTEAGLRYYRLKTASWFGSRINGIVSNAVFERLMYLPAGITERSSVSAQLSRIKAFEAVRDFFTGPLFLMYLEVPFILVTLAVIGIIAGPLVFVPIIVALAVILLLIFMHRRQKALIHRAAKSHSAKQELSIETFSKMEDLACSGSVNAWFKRYHDLSGKASYHSFLSTFNATILENIAHGLTLLAGVSTICFGVIFLLEESLTIGALIATTILVWRVLRPLQTTCSMLPRLEQVKSGIAQVNRLMDISPEHVSYAIPSILHDFKGKIIFSRVAMRYTRNSDPVFTNLSFTVNPGELIAITGSNGVGKSTILKLINNLYKPVAGTIYIDGTDSRQIDLIELRRHIAYAPQKPDFFTGTIAKNLRLAEPMATDQTIQVVLEQVDAWNEITALPEGINTVIGQGSNYELSSNLAHRLNLARAYLKHSHIFLLDELPNAILDGKCGENYKIFIETSKGFRTIFMVTQREDYIRMADKAILIREDGTTVVGPPEAVMKKA